MDPESLLSADAMADQVFEAQPDLQAPDPELTPLERAQATRNLIMALKRGTSAEVAAKAGQVPEAAEQVNNAVGEQVIDPKLVSLSMRLREARHRRLARVSGRTITRL